MKAKSLPFVLSCPPVSWQQESNKGEFQITSNNLSNGISLNHDENLGNLQNVYLFWGLNSSQGWKHCAYCISSVQSLSHVQLFATPWTSACLASLSITNSQSLLKLMPIESVMPYTCLIFCHPLLLLPSIFPSISVFFNESVLHIRWPKFGVSASSSVLPMNIQE